jgi:ferredoxin
MFAPFLRLTESSVSEYDNGGCGEFQARVAAFYTRRETDPMAHIVAEPCINCKYTDCVAVCPVDCFHEGVNFLAIDPEVCIDCGLCPPECPTTAIFAEEDLPEKWKEYIEINAKYACDWPVIDAQKEPMPGADAAAKEDDKNDRLDPNSFAG